jgi:hypothetical protein
VSPSPTTARRAWRDSNFAQGTIAGGKASGGVKYLASRPLTASVRPRGEV